MKPVCVITNKQSYMEYESTYKFLSNRRYHHSDKGCHIEMIIQKSPGRTNNNIMIKKYCKTHDIMCSKTGWEEGWYLGTNSRLLTAPTEKLRVCIKCRKKFRVKKNTKVNICQSCH